MTHPTLPLTPYVAEAIVEKKTPWRMSTSVAQRMELKPFDKSSSFKKCLLLSSDSEMDFVNRYFNQGKPSNLKIRRVYCLDNPTSTKAFESAIPSMETDAHKKVFQPNWPQGSESNRRKEVIGRWKNMGDLFGPLHLENSEISRVKAFPLWHGSDFNKCLSIASSGFAFFGKHHFFDKQAEKGATSSTDYGYFGSGVYFTDSAKYASFYSPHHLLLAWVIMREPYPVINDRPHPEKGSDMRVLAGKGAYQNYNAHYIPVSSVNPSDPHCMQYYPCYGNQKASWDEFVIFEKAQAVARLWVELIQEGANPSYTILEAMNLAEEGNLPLLKTWIEEDRTRIQAKTEEGETLAYAALLGNQSLILKWLHSQNTSLIEQVRDDQRSLPFLAVLGGRKEILNFLLDKGLSYSSSQFAAEAKKFGYTKNRIAQALESVNWSIWKIPPKTLYFSGREDVIAELRRRFSSDPFHRFTKIALTGLGGMGKSTLAAAYAHEFQNRYSLIWWIEAEKSPRSELKNLGVELGLTKIDTPEEEALKEILCYLSKNPGWLLIFDNSESPSLAQPLFPSSGKGHVLITSRDSSYTNSIPIHSFSSQESLSLLNKHTGYPSNEDAKKLAEELGHLPLALTQAGAYMAETTTSYRSYLEIYLQKRKDLILSQSLPEDYPYSVATTWKISLDKLKTTSPESLPLLYRALYLAPDNIPKSILAEEGLSNLEVNNLLKALRSYSLLNPGDEPDTFSIHRLVQTTLRDYLSPEEARKVTEPLQQILKKGWKFDRKAPNTWGEAKVLLPHLEFFSNFGADEETAEMFLNGIGVYFRNVEVDLARSIELLTHSLQIAEKIYGEEHPIVANRLDDIGFFHQHEGNLSEAIEFHNQSLAIRQKVYGEEHPDIATSFNSLGVAYETQGNLLKAIEFYNRSLEIRRKVYGEEHPDVAISLHNLGDAYRNRGNIPRAIELYNYSLEIIKKVYGDEHLDVARAMHGLGTAYQNQLDLPKAIEFYIKSIQIAKKVYGEEHPNLTPTLNNLGNVYLTQKDFSKATEFFTQALQISKRVYGDEHPSVAPSLNGLGKAHQNQGNFPKAIECYSQAFEIVKKIYGEEHVGLAQSLDGLGRAYQDQGNLPKAIEFYSKSLSVTKKVYGEDHPDTATSLNDLGRAYQADRDLPKAIEFYKESFEIMKKTLGEDHPNTKTIGSNLNQCIENERSPWKCPVM